MSLGADAGDDRGRGAGRVGSAEGVAAAGGRGRGRGLVLKEETAKGLEEQHYSRTLDG